MTTDIPKPGPPVTPIRAVPAKGAGLNQADAETRSRIVLSLLPYIKDHEALLEVAEWILLGPEGDG